MMRILSICQIDLLNSSHGNQNGNQPYIVFLAIHFCRTSQILITFNAFREYNLNSAVARALYGGGGGGVYSYIRVLPD